MQVQSIYTQDGKLVCCLAVGWINRRRLVSKIPAHKINHRFIEVLTPINTTEAGLHKLYRLLKRPRGALLSAEQGAS